MYVIQITAFAIPPLRRFIQIYLVNADIQNLKTHNRIAKSLSGSPLKQAHDCKQALGFPFDIYDVTTNSGDGIAVTKSIHENPYVSMLAIDCGIVEYSLFILHLFKEGLKCRIMKTQ